MSVTNVVFRASTRLLAATTLRNVLGMRDLAQLLSDREAISHMMQANLDEATDPWGVEVERVEMCVSIYYKYLPKLDQFKVVAVGRASGRLLLKLKSI